MKIIWPRNFTSDRCFSIESLNGVHISFMDEETLDLQNSQGIVVYVEREKICRVWRVLLEFSARTGVK